MVIAFPFRPLPRLVIQTFQKKIDELHTFVRRKLKKIYGDKMDDSDDLIPAHVLGNMWYVIATFIHAN